MRPHFVLRFYLDSARVYKRERFAAPFRVGIKPVARYAGRVFDNRKPLPRNLVEKRRFTYVRSSDDCDKRFIGICHNVTSFFAASNPITARKWGYKSIIKAKALILSKLLSANKTKKISFLRAILYCICPLIYRKSRRQCPRRRTVAIFPWTPAFF